MTITQIEMCETCQDNPQAGDVAEQCTGSLECTECFEGRARCDSYPCTAKVHNDSCGQDFCDECSTGGAHQVGCDCYTWDYNDVDR